MQRRAILQFLMILAAILIPATPVFANSLANWVLVWPGIVSIDPIFGLLPTVLVSFIERPFISRSGIETGPLIRALRANLLSLLVGIPVAAFVYSVNSLHGTIILTVAATTISIAVEIAYLQSVANNEALQLRWRWIVLGNIVSTLVLVGIALTVRTLQVNYPALGEAVRPYQNVLFVAHLTISLSAVVAALAGPRIWLLWQRFAGNMKPQPSPIEADSIPNLLQSGLELAQSSKSEDTPVGPL